MKESFKLHPQLQQDCIEIADFPLCKLLLSNDSNYPWFILVPKIANISEIYQLEWSEQQQLLNESAMLSELLMQEFQGDKMNVAALGNMVSQLHVHHIVRFKSDASWPKPVWGQLPAKAYSEEGLNLLKKRIQPKLLAILKANN